jgi:sRNA-binding carbon storage regulator CsrA
MLVIWMKEGEELVIQVDGKEAVIFLPKNKYRMKVVIDAPATMRVFRRLGNGRSSNEEDKTIQTWCKKL